MTTNVLHQRALQSRPTASAQLAIAEAAFTVGSRMGDPKWLQLGANLVTLVLDGSPPSSARFRPSADNGKPRGIPEFQFLPTWRPFEFGPTLWPPAEVYSLASNARAYLLLKQLNGLSSDSNSNLVWQAKITDALAEQEAWLKKYILPHVERTGVVPQGVFEIQDINGRTNDFGVERSTAAEDWLSFLEAAHWMGLPQEKTHRWLENLARVHGVTVDRFWGLDASLPLLRPPRSFPISPPNFCAWPDCSAMSQRRRLPWKSSVCSGTGRFPRWSHGPAHDAVSIGTGFLHLSTDQPSGLAQHFRRRQGTSGD